jgi:biotin carboxyl carrier protein
MVLINAEKRFLAATMTLCNELASRHDCERVSIGWLKKGYIRLQAISHVDQFDKKTEAVQLLEAAMEEVIDQDTEIVVPAAGGKGDIDHDHQAFAKVNDVAYICSLPLRVDEEPVAACTCERSTAPFSDVEMRLLRLSCDQASRRLADLKKHDRWFGARIAMGAREKLGKILGYEHTWLKVLVILVVILVGLLIFGRFPYRVTATAILRTDDVVFLTAPFDGHIDRVSVRVGDNVNEGDTLLSLDQNDLLLSEAALVAEKNRYSSEFDKARASNAPADMRIAQALFEQASARLDLARYQLSQSVISAPFSGVVVEGDLMERIGSPIRQGDIMFKLARIDRLYAELEVNESDIHEIKPSLEGEIALASRPQEAFDIRIFRMEPVAVPKEKGNVFIVHCSLPEGAQDWWRPGMTGIAKLNIGKRQLWWILTHRTVDFLRLRLWW